MMRAGSWRSLTIATGEIPVVGDSAQQGAANRTLEISADPFDDVREAQAMHHLVAAQHGIAGRAFIEVLRRNPRESYLEQFARIRKSMCTCADGYPQADNAALIALADALAYFYAFSPGKGWGSCVDSAVVFSAWVLDKATGAAGDTDLKAIQFIAECHVRNRLYFEDSAEMDRLERWGTIEQHSDRPGFRWYVFSSVLERALTEANFDRQKTLRRMADEGLLELGSGCGFTRQKRFRSGSRVYCVCIDNEALEAMLDAGAARPAPPSCEVEPC